MKVKSRLRRFWRHNKKMGGMWAMLLQVPFILIPPYYFSDIIFVLIAIIWLVVWKMERQVDSLSRILSLLTHKYLRELICQSEYKCRILDELIHKNEALIACEKEKQELLKELIELKGIKKEEES